MKHIQYTSILCLSLQFIVLPYALASQEASISSTDSSAEQFLMEGYDAGACEACAPIQPENVVGPILGPLNPMPAAPRPSSPKKNLNVSQTHQLEQTHTGPSAASLEALENSFDWNADDIDPADAPAPVDPATTLDMIFTDQTSLDSRIDGPD